MPVTVTVYSMVQMHPMDASTNSEIVKGSMGIPDEIMEGPLVFVGRVDGY